MQFFYEDAKSEVLNEPNTGVAFRDSLQSCADFAVLYECESAEEGRDERSSQH